MCVLGHTLATAEKSGDATTKKATPTKSTTVKSVPAPKKQDSEKSKTNDQDTIEQPSNEESVEEPEPETTQVAAPALEGLWEAEGELKICGHCVDENGSSTDCNKKTGACPIKGKCADGYSGDMCTEFECEEGCGEGTCVAPQTCYCGENINLDARSGCKDIRIRGLMGSAAALVILTLVVFMCSSVSKSVRRKKRARLAEMG